MKKRILISVIGVALVSIFFIVSFVSATPTEYVYAEQFAKEFIADEYSLQEEEIEVEVIHYWEEEDRFALGLKHVSEKKFEVALRLEEDLDLAFILDVTGLYDEFGLAYCH
ncbi:MULTISPECIES: hypothetical protein [Bacillaceae]|uniref:DUF3139 domain-containing protein n=1 Tax=Evansella alkalicola TaxID=745819 RepID=A0ABS6JYS8_9BACI|nr:MULTISPECIES: hypothetical protein [Bacillaceae]MBU9723755.1 hypothetical protein [Bacillus alkalicola]